MSDTATAYKIIKFASTGAGAELQRHFDVYYGKDEWRKWLLYPKSGSAFKFSYNRASVGNFYVGTPALITGLGSMAIYLNCVHLEPVEDAPEWGGAEELRAQKALEEKRRLTSQKSLAAAMRAREWSTAATTYLNDEWR